MSKLKKKFKFAYLYLTEQNQALVGVFEQPLNIEGIITTIETCEITPFEGCMLRGMRKEGTRLYCPNEVVYHMFFHLGLPKLLEKHSDLITISWEDGKYLTPRRSDLLDCNITTPEKWFEQNLETGEHLFGALDEGPVITIVNK